MAPGAGARLLCSLAAVTILRVKFGITLKLFLAILAACALAAIAMAVATRLSFQSGFLGYLDQVESQRLDTLSARLADEYRKRGNWDFVRGDYARLREMSFLEQPVQRLALLDAERRPVAGARAVSSAVRRRRPLLPAGTAARVLDHRRAGGGARGGGGDGAGARLPASRQAAG
jgi:hypothetical protein